MRRRLTDVDGLRAFISGCKTTALTEAEQIFFREMRPCGLILFKRNCDNPEQITALIEAYREAVDDDAAFVLIDQEGGRVQRLVPPHWRRYPSGRHFGSLYAENPERGLEAAKLCARLIARDLAALGINVNCAPVLDLPVPGAHDIIGDRAYGMAVSQIIGIGRAVAEGYLEGGVLPVIKHVPGHGRACADSHHSLPVIDAPCAELEATDFEPFRALNRFPLAMTAHVLMPDLDAHAPASASPVIIGDIIRRSIGFDGLLMCDDLSMGALSGSMEERTRAVLEAGCDVALHCSGDMDEMRAVAANAPQLTGDAARRYMAARRKLAPAEPFDMAHAETILGEVLAQFA